MSNSAAIGLYSNKFNYQCAELIAGYYADTEDAYLMSVECLQDDINMANIRRLTADEELGMFSHAN